MRLQTQVRTLPRRQAQAFTTAAGRLDADKTLRLAASHPHQRAIARVPDHGVVAVTGIDAQLALPGRVLQLHPWRTGVDLLAPALELQRAIFTASLAVEAVVASMSSRPDSAISDTSLMRQYASSAWLNWQGSLS